MDEEERVARLRAVFGEGGPGVLLGIGDDAAALAAPEGEALVVSVDAAVEHVHFERAWLAPASLGYRATMAALSDLAAMGARPLGVVASLALPRDVDEEFLEALARGQRRAVDEAGTSLVGGNLSRAGELAIHTTVLGAVVSPLRRAGARPGDRVWLAGPVGLARAGLEALLAGRAVPEDHLEAWRHPRARLAEGRAVATVATAAIDVSDGLGLDASRLARASGVVLELDGASLVDPPLEAAARVAGLAPLELALRGGEDYGLLVTAPPDVDLAPSFRPIGAARAPCGDEPGVWLAGGGEPPVPVPAVGYDHFAR